MEINISTTIEFTPKQVLDCIKDYDVADFVSLLAERFDKDFAKRNLLASKFAEHLSEQATRFLAEVVTQHVRRQSTR